MPPYTCTKCAKVFPQKSGYTAHMARKNDCAATTALPAVVEERVRDAVREAVPQGAKPPVTKETLPAFFEALHNLLWNQAGLNPEKALEHMTFFFAYRLIEDQAAALGLPQECRWSHIAAMTDAGHMYEAIDRGTASFISNAATEPFFKQHEIKKQALVYDIVQQVNRITPTALRETDMLGDVFEYMLGRGMSTMADEGQYFTNRAICKLAFKLAFEVRGGRLRRADGSLCTFADWFCGTGGFPAEFVKGVNRHLPDVAWARDCAAVHCLDMNRSSVTTTLLNMLILTGVAFGEERIRTANSFSDNITRGPRAAFPDLTIDYAFLNPPYGGDKSKGKDYRFAYAKKVQAADGSTHKQYFVNEDIQSIGVEEDSKVSAGVQLAMATLSADGGVCCIVLPQGFFFGATKQVVELRRRLALEYRIHCVVDVASGAFANTGTKTSMVVFQRGVGATQTVRFIDMEERELATATAEQLRGKGFSLNYKSYVPQAGVAAEGFEMVRLGDLVTFAGGKFTTTFAQEHPGEFPFFSGKACQPDGTCAQNCFDGDEYLVMVKDGGSGAGNYGENIGLGKTFHAKGKSAGTSHNLALYPRPGAAVLVKYLHISLTTLRHKIMDLAKYTTGLGVVSQADLVDLRIPLPSLERQREVVEAIDVWASLAQQEQAILAVLERQMEFDVREMGRGIASVPLGDVITVSHGKRITKSDDAGTMYPVYGGGGATFHTDASNRAGWTCKVSRFGISEHNCVTAVHGSYWLLDSGFTVTAVDGKATDAYVAFWLLQNKQRVFQCGRATAQMNIDMQLLLALEIPLPALADQQRLQPHFDEIRHKHAKIAEYKVLAQAAVQRFIPRADEPTAAPGGA